jgi:hypothetical protein
MDERADEWVSRCMSDTWVNEWTSGRMNRQISGKMEGWTHGWINGRIEGYQGVRGRAIRYIGLMTSRINRITDKRYCAATGVKRVGDVDERVSAAHS